MGSVSFCCETVNGVFRRKEASEGNDRTEAADQAMAMLIVKCDPHIIQWFVRSSLRKIFKESCVIEAEIL